MRALSAGVALVLVLLAQVAPTRAATINVTASTCDINSEITPHLVGSTHVAQAACGFSIARFDPSLGTLTEVQPYLSNQATFTTIATNPTPTVQNVTLGTQADVTITTTDPSEINANWFSQYHVAPAVGLSCCDAQTIAGGAAIGNSPQGYDVTGQDAVAHFVGSGEIPLTLTAFIAFDVIDGASSITYLNRVFDEGGYVQLTYTYDPTPVVGAVPEPGSFTLMVLPLMIAACRRRLVFGRRAGLD